MSRITFEVYRNEGKAAGTTKDWAIGTDLNAGIVVIKYGTTGQKLRVSIVKSANPQTEMFDRIRKKVSSGYYHVGQATYDADAKSIDVDQVKNPNLIWSLSNVRDTGVLVTRLEHLMDRISTINLPEPCDFQQGQQGVTTSRVDRLVISHKLIMDTHSAIESSANNFTLGGIVERKSSTLPLMFLLAIAKGIGGLSFCDEDNQPITVEYLGKEAQFATSDYSLDLLNDIAIALELKKPPVSLYQPTQQNVKPLLQLRI